MDWRDGIASCKCVRGYGCIDRCRELSCCVIQKAVRNIACNKDVALAEFLEWCFEHEVATLFSFMDEAARDAGTSLQDDDAHCKSTMQECLEWLVVHGGVQCQNDPSHLQDCSSAVDGSPSGSVDLDSGF